jgi:hypothetical protein
VIRDITRPVRWATDGALNLAEGAWSRIRGAANVRGAARFVWRLVKYTPLFFLALAAVGYIVFNSHRDVAYRYAEPGSNACKDQNERMSWALAEAKNDEYEAIRNWDIMKEAFTCMIQVHDLRKPHSEVSAPIKADHPLRYYLSFVEFTEAGTPAELGQDGNVVKINQLRALVDHLREQRRQNKQNYVMVYIHGWRHNASIGDDDVQKLRIFAAYAASFLAFRCTEKERYCNTAVTAVYVGWRGARVDEQLIRRWSDVAFVRPIGELFAAALAIPTLFDRKPVSEQIGPAAITALRQIDRVVFDRAPEGWKRAPENRMITFGHSLGGNMLATGLREMMVERIHRHVPETVMTSPFGNLIVLLNPASEAMNWTSLQRAMREKIRFVHTLRDEKNDAETQKELDDIIKGHDFFPDQQPPIYIALSSANTWPAGGLRRGDARYLKDLISHGSNPSEKAAAQETCDALLRRAQILDRPHYDWATHDLFPAFKFDFRPLANTIEQYALDDTNVDPCQSDDQDRSADLSISNRLLVGLAGFFRNLPFTNTDVEQTRTIGHLNPMRSPIGTLSSGSLLPSTNYGTTHELVVNISDRSSPDFLKASYDKAADPRESECAIVDNWLWNARDRAGSYGNYWDSGDMTTDVGRLANITPVRRPGSVTETNLASDFRHGHLHGGTAPIVRANDPFWNIRAFETAMRGHGDFVSYPLICAIQQLVLDDVAKRPE